MLDEAIIAMDMGGTQLRFALRYNQKLWIDMTKEAAYP